MNNNYDDGVQLVSMSHPRQRGSFWRHLWWKLFPPKLNEDALEEIEIEISDSDAARSARFE